MAKASIGNPPIQFVDESEAAVYKRRQKELTEKLLHATAPRTLAGPWSSLFTVRISTCQQDY